MTDCVFCKVVSGELPADIVYQDDRVVAFRDISPKAPIHVLIVPREHIATLNDVSEGHASLVGHMHFTASLIARDLGIAEKGYRVVMNCNEEGGQEVFHIHLHLLGGKQLSWPPGC